MAAVVPYALAPEFERGLVYCLATSPSVYAAVATHLEPEAFPSAEARTLVKIFAQIYETLGRGPVTETEVVQEVTAHARDRGKITIDHLHAVVAYLELGATHDVTAEAALKLFRPQLQNRVRDEAIRSSLSGASTEDCVAQLQASLTVGVLNQSPSSEMSADWYHDIARLNLMETVPTGCAAVDIRMKGGAAKGQLFVAGGGSNSGKSSWLRQMAAIASREGGAVLFVTNQTPLRMVKAMILADLTNIPFAKIMSGDFTDPAHKQSWARYHEGEQRWGPIHTMWVAPGDATPQTIFDEAKRIEDRHGYKLLEIGIDYADRLTDGNLTGSPDYIVMRNVYEPLTVYAQENNCVVATGSQVKDKKKGAKYLTESELSDSKHKGRIAEQVITLNPEKNDEGEKEMWVYIAKQKLDEAEIAVGPVATDFAFGRFSKLSKRIHAGARPSEAARADAVESAMMFG